ncbi:MAG: adenylyltransferase/cytidyltransferase family protein [Parachlamydia sp.]|nr:adenylyltransferase/cytidyltransferase family protein [Parachlamydia sp.]
MWQEACQTKVIPPAELEAKIAELRSQGHTIATLNGTFDLMHAGHLHIIFEASKQADKLIVALNSDSSIKQYKSVHRPIIPLKYRLEMMAALGFVDYVTWFDETDPRLLLSRIKPDVHVNGADYGANCIESEVVLQNGGRLHLVELVPSLSTTQIVKKILQLPPDGK